MKEDLIKQLKNHTYMGIKLIDVVERQASINNSSNYLYFLKKLKSHTWALNLVIIFKDRIHGVVLSN